MRTFRTRSQPKAVPAGAPPADRPPSPEEAGTSERPRAPVPAEPAPRGGLRPALRAVLVVVAFAGMVVFAAVLSRLTLEPSAASESLTYSNLEPGASITNYLAQPAFQDAVKQVGGNIALGVPFGILLPVLAPQTRGLLRVVFTTAAVMMLVELVQGALITGRTFDIDDVILNTSGALLGYLLIGRRLGRAVHPHRRHWWQRRRKPAEPQPEPDPAP
ncbi:VanZ family protein [Streptomyces sp. 549]|uniref:VanZ family protein n=1 Tax=Streptomyces sp. 549 TaxID=3049076 RepID=UPI0024C3C48D|nr:VanZ family protein [Streptomyces sp. 549]MDK1475802.1 VanZ family protein [Streptomyces sp. 549]